MISDCRVLDLTDHRCWLCGKILAELGFEVIKAEKPGGDPGRSQGPFLDDDPGPERSLLWLAYNTSKKGITLDVGTADGREIFRKLAATADVIVESFPPGYLDELGIGYQELSGVNHRLILTSIASFGQSGPYREFKESHAVLMALSGLMSTIGDPDRPPVEVGFSLAYVQGSTQAASATMIAYHARQRTGQGQHVDVSLHHSIAYGQLGAIALWHLQGLIMRRAGQLREARTLTGANPRYVWPCKDGFVSSSVGGGPVYVKSLQALIRWMKDEGMAGDFLKEFDWTGFDMVKITPDLLRQVEEPIGEFFLARTKAELFDGAVKRGVILFPVATPADIAEDEQLKARDFWVSLKHEELGASITYPGSFAVAPHIPCLVKHRAPLIGEHNQEVYGLELGLSRQQLAVLKQAGVI